MVKLEFHDPSGMLDASKPYAPRLASLAGKRIGMLSNGQWQAYRMLPLLKTLLEADFPGIEVLSEDNYPQGNTKIGIKNLWRAGLPLGKRGVKNKMASTRCRGRDS